jgi:hypothetical protein
MLLSSLCSINSYLKWFIEYGYRIIYAEDITDRTIKTWDDALPVLRESPLWRLASKITRDELPEILRFLRSIGLMKLAMKKGRLNSGLIVAERK